MPCSSSTEYQYAMPSNPRGQNLTVMTGRVPVPGEGAGSMSKLRVATPGSFI